MRGWPFSVPCVIAGCPGGQAPSIWGAATRSSMRGSSPRTRRCARRCGARWNPACRRSPNAVGFCTCSAKSPIARGGAGLLRAPLRAQARTGEGCPISGTWSSLPNATALRAVRHTHPRARVPLLAVHLPGRRLLGAEAPARQGLAVHDDTPSLVAGFPHVYYPANPDVARAFASAAASFAERRRHG